MPWAVLVCRKTPSPTCLRGPSGRFTPPPCASRAAWVAFVVASKAGIAFSLCIPLLCVRLSQWVEFVSLMSWKLEEYYYYYCCGRWFATVIVVRLCFVFVCSLKGNGNQWVNSFFLRGNSGAIFGASGTCELGCPSSIHCTIIVVVQRWVFFGRMEGNLSWRESAGSKYLDWMLSGDYIITIISCLQSVIQLAVDCLRTRIIDTYSASYLNVFSNLYIPSSLE